MAFDCDHGVFSEDVNCTHGDSFISQVTNGQNIGNASSTRCPIPFYLNNNLFYINTFAYSQALSSYTRRSISYQSDALHAFSGIMARLRPLFRGEFIYGLPETELDIALLWQPHGKLTRNVDPVSGKALFPSWSWAGWVGSSGKSPIWSQKTLSRVMWQDFTRGRNSISPPNSVDQAQ
jgi:hypothetical protein